jgi:hypothetical protein
MTRQLPQVDRGVSMLVRDLYERGLDKDVVVVMWGEFGRTPKINAAGGRDHWPQAMSALVVGGGLKMGQLVGSTDARGEHPKDRPYRVPNVLSTVCHVLGIDPAKTFTDGAGRPQYILDRRELVTELL